MKKYIAIPLLSALVLLSSCNGDSKNKVQENVVAEPAKSVSIEDVVALAKSASTTHEPLDDVCPRVNPDNILVDNITVGLVSDVGSIDDGTFNQAAFAGMEAASRCYGLATTFLESAGDDAQDRIQSLVDRNVDIIVAAGFQFQEAVAAAAKARPDIRFIGVDQFNTNNSPNYVALSFRDDQVGFLAGAIAGLMSSTGKVAIIAGPDSVPPVVAIADGFESGAKTVSPQTEVLRRHMDSFNDPLAGSAQATAFIDKGADVLFGAAGNTGTGATRNAAARGAYVVGVDQDEYYTTFSGGAEVGADRLITSAIKRVDLGVFLTLAAMSHGGIEGGDFLLNVSNGGVTYAPFHQVDVPDEIAKQLEALRVGLASGDVVAIPDGNTQLSSND